VGETIVQVSAADGFPLVAAREGRVADDAIVLLLRVVVPVFAFIGVVIVYSAFRFRAREGDEQPGSAQPRDDRRFSWSWLAATSGLTILVIIAPGVTGVRDIFAARDAKNPLVVEVTALQWEWRFSYPRQGLTDRTELVLPVDRPVRFVLRSEDVIHGFWVPAFRIKQDVVPGQTTDLYLTPDRMVSTSTSPLARVQCAELCGAGHAEMRSEVRVVSPTAFTAWAIEQKQAAP
jgi:cytochrome c oxidase subunit 2